VDAEFVWPFMADANAWAAARPGVEIVPLYRSPTLTDEERAAIQAGIDALCTLNEDDAAMPLRALLKRLQ
jgi:hypothetical protein